MEWNAVPTRRFYAGSLASHLFSNKVCDKSIVQSLFCWAQRDLIMEWGLRAEMSGEGRGRELRNINEVI